jgi:hypothetical protein
MSAAQTIAGYISDRPLQCLRQFYSLGTSVEAAENEGCRGL